MIISRRHRFIYVAVPRTGSQSVRRALRPHLGPEDEEQALWRTRKALTHPELARVEHGHITALEARDHLGPELWESSFTFAFVRDPWERFLSAAVLVFRDDPLFRTDPVACLRLHIQTESLYRRVHFRPQVESILDSEGAALVEFVGRVERFEVDFSAVLDRAGLSGVRMEHLHRSPPADRSAWRDPELVRHVAERYSADYEAFGYPIPR